MYCISSARPLLTRLSQQFGQGLIVTGTFVEFKQMEQLLFHELLQTSRESACSIIIFGSMSLHRYMAFALSLPRLSPFGQDHMHYADKSILTGQSRRHVPKLLFIDLIVDIVSSKKSKLSLP